MTEAANHLLFGAAPPAHWPVLEATARLLLERGLPAGHPWQVEAAENLSVLAGAVASSTETSAEALDEIMDALARMRILTGSPFAVFLAARVKEDAYRRQGNLLSAWILAAALRRLRTSPGQNAIWQGINAARGLKTKAPAELQRLTDALYGPEVLLDALDLAAKDNTLSKTVRGYFRSLAALIRAAIRQGPAIHRERETGAAVADSRAPLPLQKSEPIGNVRQISGGFTPESARFAGPDALQRADRNASTLTLQGQNDPESFAPRKLAQGRLRKAARAAARRDLSLSAEQDPLTDHELAILTGWLASNRDHPAHAPLLADLALGSAHVNSAGTWALANGQLGFLLAADLPDFEPLVETGDADDDRLLFLPAPPLAVDPGTPGEARMPIKAALKLLQPDLARSLTRGRIARYKADWLRRAGADSAIIGFLTGQSPGNRAQMHYSRIDRATLVDWHRRYLEEGLGLDLPEWEMPAGGYGARLHLPRDFLRIVFDEARKDVRYLRPHGQGSFSQVMAAHNAYLVYTLMVLYLGSGHRPVTHPFEYRGDFDLEAGLLWVSDKTGRGARGARLLPLPARAVAQAKAWIAHLGKLQNRLRLTHSTLADGPLQAALSIGEVERGPLFLRFDAAGNLQPLRPSIQEEAVEPVLPAALNWARHVLRSTLLTTCCDPAALDAFLGHGHVGEDPFVAGSSLGLSDLFPVAERIEALMEEYGIKSLESPL